MTLTSCNGNKLHEAYEVIPCRLDHAGGVVQIGSEAYLVDVSADGCDLTFSKSDGATYKVSCWSQARGNYGCTCRDWQFRRTAEQRQCKHLRAAFAIKARLLGGM